ncbi:LytTR family DNA-binding domain-containing protein [Sphingobacterium humi]|nr:LytTR family DNA-binding domain-containing protein [Sphingobacterium humi]
MRKPAFYIAMIASFIIALCLSSTVHLITKQLDKRYSWWLSLPYRALLQFLFGLCLPAILAFLLAGLYFTIMGADIFETGYVLVDFPVIIAILALFNFYYVVHNMWLTARQYVPLRLQHQIADTQEPLSIYENVQETIVEEPIHEKKSDTKSDQAVLLLISSGNKNLFMDVNNEAGIIYRISGNNWIYTNTGKTYLVKQSIKEILTTYCNSDFFQISRQTVIHRNIIEGYEQGTKSGTLLILIKPDLQVRFIDTSVLNVSQDKVADFKKWMENTPKTDR